MKYQHEKAIIEEKRYKQLTSHNCVFSLEYLFNHYGGLSTPPNNAIMYSNERKK
jgi:hypothetical protein